MLCTVLLTNSSKILNILRECITIQKKLERKPIWSPEKHAKYFRLDLDWIWKLRDVNNTAESDSAVSFTPWARKTKKRRRKNSAMCTFEYRCDIKSWYESILTYLSRDHSWDTTYCSCRQEFAVLACVEKVCRKGRRQMSSVISALLCIF